MIHPHVMSKWDRRFLNLCRHLSTWSKDPSTKLGAVIIRNDQTIVSMGYNGLPRNVDDSDERLHNRELKYELVVHGEMNAIITAREPLHGHTLFTYPLPPCSRCSAAIIQTGIKHIISVIPEERWYKNCKLGADLLNEAGLNVTWYNPELVDVENSFG